MERLQCKARVRLSTGSGVTGSGKIRDIGSKGAFIETLVAMPLQARVHLFILGNETARDVVERAATIVRVDHDGMEVEWCQPESGSICSAVGCKVRCDDSGSA